MSDHGSVSRWIHGLKAGEAEAAQRLWDRYVHQLVRLARQRLGSAPRSVVDEEDIVQTVFSTICRGATDGRFNDVKNRDELWWLLIAITRQNVATHVRNECTQKRGAGRVYPESQLTIAADGRSAFDIIVGADPTPDFLAMLDDQFQRLLGLLRDDRLREIAIMRFEGYTIAEIAEKLTISTRSVERKLQLIRSEFVTFLNQSG
jgi:RNA polymerase sigma factor (sigma-70 family)